MEITLDCLRDINKEVLINIVMLNRLETYRGLRDVKYIVYKLIHQHDLQKTFNELKSMLEWSDEYMCYTGFYYCKYTLMVRRGPLFNKRHLGFEMLRTPDRYINKISKDDMVNRDLVLTEHNTPFGLPKYYVYSSDLFALIK